MATMSELREMHKGVGDGIRCEIGDLTQGRCGKPSLHQYTVGCWIEQDVEKVHAHAVVSHSYTIHGELVPLKKKPRGPCFRPTCSSCKRRDFLRCARGCGTVREDRVAR